MWSGACTAALVLASLAAAAAIAAAALPPPDASTQRLPGPGTALRTAYAVLVYGSNIDATYALGACVLGRSLLATDTAADMVAIVTPDVTPAVRADLQAAGWTLWQVQPLSSPVRVGDQRLGSVFTRLRAWQMTQYDRVIVLDSDFLVLHNIDDLFACGGFCAAWLSPYWFNAGMLVITPSDAVFQKMQRVLEQPQHGGYIDYDMLEQGFLNNFYRDAMAAAATFDPVAPASPLPPAQRVPPVYNGDLGLFLKDGRFKTDPDQPIRTVQFITSYLKPWKWYTYLINPWSWTWTALRSDLQPAGPLLAWCVLLAPLAVPLAALRRWYLRAHGRAAPALQRRLPRPLAQKYPMLHVLAPLLAPVGVVLLLPATTHPLLAWTIMLQYAAVVPAAVTMSLRPAIVPFLLAAWFVFALAVRSDIYTKLPLLMLGIAACGALIGSRYTAMRSGSATDPASMLLLEQRRRQRDIGNV